MQSATAKIMSTVDSATNEAAATATSPASIYTTFANLWIFTLRALTSNIQ